MGVKFYLAEENGVVWYQVTDAQAEPLEIEGLELLEADTKDAALEKHVPELTKNGAELQVVVGSVEHPMTEEHYIQFIAIEQDGKVQLKKLAPGDAPKATFLVDEGPLTVYEYCNLHGLWKKEA